MTRRSTVDLHPERESIRRDLVLGVPLRVLAKRWGINITSLWRAKQRLPDSLRKAVLAAALAPSEQDLEKLKIEESAGLLANLKMQRVKLLLAQDAALASEQFNAVATLGAQIQTNLRITAQYLGELVPRSETTTHSTVSLVMQPEYVELRGAIMKALQAHPEARQAVAKAIQRIEARDTAPALVDVTPQRIAP